jgi:hypothetical protein
MIVGSRYSDRKSDDKSLTKKKAIKWAQKQKGSLKTLAQEVKVDFFHLFTLASTLGVDGTESEGR